MINYLSARYFLAFPWSIGTRNEISAQSRKLLESLTNDINVVVYYDQNNVLYDRIKGLLKDYQRINPRIKVSLVDYLVDAGEAQKTQDSYRDFMGPGMDTNLVIFSSGSGTNLVHGEELGTFQIEPGEHTGEYRKVPVYFEGEQKFTSAIFRLINPKPVRAYFLEGLDAVHRLNGTRLEDYKKFNAILQINNVEATNILTLSGTNGVPADCKLLIIAGPGILTHNEVENVQ